MVDGLIKPPFLPAPDVDVEGNSVRVDARMARPNNGAVADNGTFCLEDWHFGSTLSGTFHVFNAQGAPIITKELSANILDSGISQSGRLAFCTTANSPTDDVTSKRAGSSLLCCQHVGASGSNLTRLHCSLWPKLQAEESTGMELMAP